MPLIIIVVLAFFLPRVTIALLWLSGWFAGTFATPLWPVLGFFLMPYTLLWYAIVLNQFGGIWGPVEVLGLVVAVAADLSSSGYGYRHYSHYDVIDEG